MPANWLYMDAKFPNFEGETSTEDKLDQLQNYLYLLVEQMRYTTQNLDTTNMNQTALAGWEEAITRPLYLKLEGEGQRLTQPTASPPWCSPSNSRCRRSNRGRRTPIRLWRVWISRYRRFLIG